MSPVTRRLIAFLVVAAAASSLYVATFDLRTISDTTLNSLQTRALALHGDANVARYRLPPTAFAFPRGSGLYSIYGVGISVVSLPVYLVLARTHASEGLLQAAAVIPFLALAAGVMWSVVRRLAPAAIAAAATAVFAFGTTLWPLAAMALYQNASVVLFQALGLKGFFSEGRRMALLAGAGFGAAAFVRLPAAVPIVVVGLFYLVRERRNVVPFAAGVVPFAAGIVIQNRWIWGNWGVGGYAQAGIGFHSSMGHALWGLLFGWWRGMFVYTPALLVGIAGGLVALRNRDELDRKMIALGVSVIATIVLYARWTTWFGGLNQFGYRYLLDVVPMLVVLGAYAVTRAPRLQVPALGLAVISVITMTFGVAPNRFGWDQTFFETRFSYTSLGQAWIAAFDRPAATLLRLTGVAAACTVMVGATLFARGSEPVQEHTTILQP